MYGYIVDKCIICIGIIDDKIPWSVANILGSQYSQNYVCLTFFNM